LADKLSEKAKHSALSEPAPLSPASPWTIGELTGGCLCGAVRYQSAASEYRSTLCHCASCRRSSGAHALGWVTVAVRGFRITAGTAAEYRSSPSVSRTFCSQCGSTLTYAHESWPAEISLCIGSLDAPEGVPPHDHIWMSDALAWDLAPDGLPQYPGDRP
jgi:hypothetical protein